MPSADNYLEKCVNSARALLVLIFLAACTGTEPAVLSISFDQGDAMVVEIHDTIELTVSVSVRGGAIRDVQWHTTCGQIESQGGVAATYTAPGVAGICAVSATSTFDSSKRATISVEVVDAPTVIDIGITNGDLRLAVGRQIQLLADVLVVGGASTEVAWHISNPEVGSVDTAGLLTTLGAGTAAISAESVADRTKSAVIELNVLAISIDQGADLVVQVDGSVTLSATVSAGSGIDRSVVWSASCGTLDGDGAAVVFIAPRTSSTCVIEASSLYEPSVSASANVSVVPMPAVPSYVSVENVVLHPPDTTAGTREIGFDISWAESWRGPERPTWVAADDNWDAAWVFVKYLPAYSGSEWRHATLRAEGHTAPLGSEIDIPLDRKGAFIYRDSPGYGEFSAGGVRLLWDYEFDGVDPGLFTVVRVVAIEMVYVSGGPFFVGSGGDEPGAFRAGPTSEPFIITSQAAINLGDSAGYLSWAPTGYSGTPTGSTQPSFPTGFSPFYIMKYPISQRLYVEFLNGLTPTQLIGRSTGSTANRHGISGNRFDGFMTTLPYVGMESLPWSDAAAFADWAAIRPFTELEFEKAARGLANPYPNEFAWGNASIVQANDIVDVGSITESVSPSDANAVYGDAYRVQGPVRVGSFAAPGKSREQAGAGYYGALDLSGSLLERAITLGNEAGRSFTGTHGDGQLTAGGQANAPSWPVGDAAGSGFRGGAWDSPVDFLRASDRDIASYAYSSGRSAFGFRGARSAP